MSQLTTILGGMIVDQQFRTKMVTNRAATLTEYKIDLSGDERDSLESMMASFGTGMFDPCLELFASECPNWPCASFQMTIPPVPPAATIRRAAKKPAPRPPRPVRKTAAKKAAVKKASGKKTAGKRKKTSRS
jgi:hypothetical protein